MEKSAKKSGGIMPRVTFSSKIGFVLAAAGSAVGLGNIWRFPYLAAKYGGGIFILVYIALVITFGFSLMISEIALGRKTGFSVIRAYSSLNKKWAFLGVISAIIPMIIVPYYCVIGGWVTKYLFVMATRTFDASRGFDTFFGAFIGSATEPVAWFLVFSALTVIIVLLGVKKGIEKANTILMPVLVILMLGVTIYAMTLPGAINGVKFYFYPDFSKFSVNTVLAAMGQMFYSMSLAMGIMVTYGSYMKKTDDIEGAVKQIEWFDTGIALLAGLMIVPAVFIFSGGDKINAGPSLMFITMPQIFNSMGSAGDIVGAVFFLLVLFAALTSSISLLETVVSVFIDRFELSRRNACIVSIMLIVVLGLASSFGYSIWDGFNIGGMAILDLFDFTTNSVMMPLVALGTCIFIGFVLKPKSIIDEVLSSGKFSRQKMYGVFIKFIAPVFLGAILISSVLNSLGIFKI